MATQMRSFGIDRLVVSKLLNHAESGITKTYDRYAADPEKAPHGAMGRQAPRDHFRQESREGLFVACEGGRLMSAPSISRAKQ